MIISLYLTLMSSEFHDQVTQTSVTQCRSSQADFAFVSLSQVKFSMVLHHWSLPFPHHLRAESKVQAYTSFLQCSGDNISVLEKKIIYPYFCLLSFNQLGIQVKSHSRWISLGTTFGEKSHKSLLDTHLGDIKYMLGYKLLAILFQFTRWDHTSCS